MRTDTVVKREGINALIAQLGYVDAGRFIALINGESFDYTKWREQFLDAESSVHEISQKQFDHGGYGDYTAEKYLNRCCN